MSKDVVLKCTRYDAEARRVDLQFPDGRELKDVVVVDSEYKKLREFKRVLVTLPKNGRLTPKKEVTFFSKTLSQLLTVRPHWAYGSKNLVFNIYAAKEGLSIRNPKNIPLGNNCLVNLIFREKTYPTGGKQLIVDAYVCDNRNSKPEYCFDYADYNHTKAEASYLLPELRKNLRIWKWGRGSRPGIILHEDQL